MAPRVASVTPYGWDVLTAALFMVGTPVAGLWLLRPPRRHRCGLRRPVAHCRLVDAPVDWAERGWA